MKNFQVYYLGKLSCFDILEKEFGKLITDDVIVTDERIEHIRQRHGADYGFFVRYIKQIIASPDYILKDEKNAGTIMMVMKCEDTNLNVVLRLVLEQDDNRLLNSVVTFHRARDSYLCKMLKKHKAIYKRE